MRPTSFKTRFWLGLAIAAIVLVVPATAQAENVVPNPGFEATLCRNTPNGTELPVCGWDSWWEVARDTSNPHSGQASMQLTCGQWPCEYGDPYAFSACNGTWLSAGTHHASFWYRSEPSAFPSIVGFVIHSACDSGGLPVYFDAVTVDDGAWHEVTGIIDVGIYGGGFQYRLFTEMSCEWCSLSVNFDDLVVEGDSGATSPIRASRLAWTEGPN